MRGQRAVCHYLIEKGASIRLRDAANLSAVDHMNRSSLTPEVLDNIGGAVVSDPDMRQLFKRLSPDQDDTVDLREFEARLGEFDPIGLPAQADAARFRDILAEAHARRDGRLRYSEFARVILRVSAL
eukprot:TRINITY_DN15695_c0_g1_i1.p2 TRINITY_DN15695_c0_g1~~TRINITY_DN15695_c0_g1_i1.p2  ORF type:complete len:127 (+),score=40.66 TRINITY_DN15695_c0_g1_i1:501-881(+)